MLQRGEAKAKLQQEIIDKTVKKSKSLLDLAFTSVDLYEFQNENYAQKKKDDEIALKEAFFRENQDYLVRTRREKKSINSTLDINALEREMLNNCKINAPPKIRIMKLPEHHLFPQRERLTELLTRESEFKNRQKIKPLINNSVQKEIQKEVEEIGLTPEEIEEKDKLLSAGFQNWNKQDFTTFIQGCERFGRNEFEKIEKHIGGSKTLEEIKKYSKAFWERILELSEGSKIVKMIERGEKNLESRAQAERLVRTFYSYKFYFYFKSFIRLRKNVKVIKTQEKNWNSTRITIANSGINSLPFCMINTLFAAHILMDLVKNIE